MARVGMGQSPPWGAEERFCGIGSLAKIWAEKFRDSGRSAPPRSPACPATHKQNCNTRKNGSCPLGKKEGHVITRYVLQPAGAAPQARTHNTVNRNTETPGRRGSLRPARSLKHSAGPGKTEQKKTHLKLQKRVHPWGSVRAAGAGEESPRSLSACQGERSPRGYHQADRTASPGCPLLKGKACVWLPGACLGYRPLPTSTTMAELIYRFPE